MADESYAERRLELVRDGARGVVLGQAGRVAEHGDVFRAEGVDATTKGGGDGLVHALLVGHGQGIILVEDAGFESGSLEGGPVHPSDVRDLAVGYGELLRGAEGHAEEEGDARDVDVLHGGAVGRTLGASGSSPPSEEAGASSAEARATTPRRARERRASRRHERSAAGRATRGEVAGDALATSAARAAQQDDDDISPPTAQSNAKMVDRGRAEERARGSAIPLTQGAHNGGGSSSRHISLKISTRLSSEKRKALGGRRPRTGDVDMLKSTS